MRWLKWGGSTERIPPDLVLADPPRNTIWTVTPGRRTEVRGVDGGLVAWTRGDRKLFSLRDESGRHLVSYNPGVAQIFSARNIMETAVEGALGMANPLPPTSGGGPAMTVPALNLRHMPTGIVFAAITADVPNHLVTLLPGGRLNDRILSRKLDPDSVSRLRAISPLVLTVDGSLQLLTDANGVVLGTATFTGDDLTSVEVLDNPLPGPWLLAIMIGAHHWHG